MTRTERHPPELDAAVLAGRAASTDDVADMDRGRPVTDGSAVHANRTGTASLSNDLKATRYAGVDSAVAAADDHRSVLTGRMDEYGVFQALDDDPRAVRQSDLEWGQELLVLTAAVSPRDQAITECSLRRPWIR